MVGSGTAGGQGQKGIAVLNAPRQNGFHRVYAEFLDIVLENNRGIVLLNAVNYVLDDHIRIGGLSRIATKHIPVKILEAPLRHILHQGGHDARGETGNGIGAAPGETQERGFLTGLFLDDRLYLIQIRKISSLAFVDLTVFMAVGVDANGMARSMFLAD